MTIKTRLENLDEDTPNYWHFQLYGPDTAEATVRIATTSQIVSEGQNPSDWVSANLAAAQNLIDTEGVITAFTLKEEGRIFLQENPQAEGLLDLGYNSLHTAIENRNQAQETLLLKAYAHAIRYIYRLIQEEL